MSEVTIREQTTEELIMGVNAVLDGAESYAPGEPRLAKDIYAALLAMKVIRERTEAKDREIAELKERVKELDGWKALALGWKRVWQVTNER